MKSGEQDSTSHMLSYVKGTDGLLADSQPPLCFPCHLKTLNKRKSDSNLLKLAAVFLLLLST